MTPARLFAERRAAHDSAARSVLVTGAAKGIGAACTLRLAREGWRVFAGVRSQADGEALRKAPGDIVPVILDITDSGQIAAAVHRVEQESEGPGLAAIVNNAGIAVAGPLEFLPVDELRRQLEINVVGQLAVTQAFLPLLRRARLRGGRGNGRIIFMSSVSGRSALPFIGAYAASKFALEAAADALRLELRPFGLDVVLIEPGVIATPIWDASSARLRASRARLPAAAHEHYAHALSAAEGWTSSSMGGLPPERVAAAVLRALTARRPSARYVIGSTARARILLEQLLPARLRDWLVHRGVQRLQQRSDDGGRHDP